MSTRSIIGTTDGSDYEGIYCHFDGAPTHMLAHLARIVATRGSEGVEVLAGQRPRPEGGYARGWSFIASDMPALPETLPYPDYSSWAEANPDPLSRDRRWQLLYNALGPVPTRESRNAITAGYGATIACADAMMPPVFAGTLGRESTLGMCEWAYLFTEDLSVLVCEARASLVEVACFTYEELVALADGDEELRDRVQVAECGEGFSRCSHMAWAHDSSVPEESRGLSMREWIGRDPMGPESAVAAIVDGERVEFTGSGMLRDGNWAVSVKGRSEMVPVYRQQGITRVPLPGVALIYPPVREDMLV